MPGSGSVTLDVTGTVVNGPARHAARPDAHAATGPDAHAAAGPVLYTGHARAGKLTPYSVTLAPTAAGLALGRPHGALRLTARVSFQPPAVRHGKHKVKPRPIVASQSFAVAAT
jgi:hypothetical protein